MEPFITHIQKHTFCYRYVIHIIDSISIIKIKTLETIVKIGISILNFTYIFIMNAVYPKSTKIYISDLTKRNVIVHVTLRKGEL